MESLVTVKHAAGEHRAAVADPPVQRPRFGERLCRRASLPWLSNGGAQGCPIVTKLNAGDRPQADPLPPLRLGLAARWAG